MTDVIVTDHGRLVEITLVSERAKLWVDENTHIASCEWVDNSFTLGSGCAGSIISNMLSDGFELEVV
jgi:hypothetical protein